MQALRMQNEVILFVTGPQNLYYLVLTYQSKSKIENTFHGYLKRANYNEAGGVVGATLQKI